MCNLSQSGVEDQQGNRRLNTMNQIDLIDIYRTFYIAKEYTFLSSTRGTVFKIDHMLGCKTSHSKFRRTEIIQSMTSNHNGSQIEMQNRRRFGKFTSMCKLNNTLLNDQQAKG